MRHFATLGVALTLLVVAGAAGAADGDAYLKSCYSTAPAGSCVALTPGFQGADVELSPGARHLYAAVWGVGGGYTGLRLFDVGTRGAFAPREGVEGCYAPGGAGGDCTPLIADGGAYDLDISADGRSVYLPTGGKPTALNRETTPRWRALAPAPHRARPLPTGGRPARPRPPGPPCRRHRLIRLRDGGPRRRTQCVRLE